LIQAVSEAERGSLLIQLTTASIKKYNKSTILNKHVTWALFKIGAAFE
jgi:hypothetical protein